MSIVQMPIGPIAISQMPIGQMPIRSNYNQQNANQSNANQQNANQLNANQLNANQLNANQLKANQLNANQLNANRPNAHGLHAYWQNAHWLNAHQPIAKLVKCPSAKNLHISTWRFWRPSTFRHSLWRCGYPRGTWPGKTHTKDLAAVNVIKLFVFVTDNPGACTIKKFTDVIYGLGHPLP
jgi:hypothetical protein